MKHAQGMKFKLVIGFIKNGRLHHEVPVGMAIEPEGKSYFSVRLWSLPRICFYLVSHTDGKRGRRYTLFARKIETPNRSVHFQNPIGSGAYSEEIPGYIEIRTRLPRSRFFLCLLDPVSMEREALNSDPYMRDQNPRPEQSNVVGLNHYRKKVTDESK